MHGSVEKCVHFGRKSVQARDRLYDLIAYGRLVQKLLESVHRRVHESSRDVLQSTYGRFDIR
jgi:hypothetical protein